MRILLITRFFPPPVNDGMTRYAGNLAYGLAGTGARVVVLSGNAATPEPDESRAGKALVRHSHRAAETLKHIPTRWARFARRIERCVRDHQSDVIVIQHPYHSAAALRAAEHCGVPVIYVCHTASALERERRQGEPGYLHDHKNERRERLAFQGADRVLCVSQRLQGELVRLYDVPAERLGYVPTGVPAIQPLETDRVRAARRDVAEGEMIVLYVGRDSWAKGTDVVPEIIRASLARRADLRFVLLGIERRRWARYVLTPRTLVLPWLNDGELAALMRWGHMIVVPSRSDTMPYALLESMSARCVPVVSAVDGLGEVVRHGQNGFSVPVDTSAGRPQMDPAGFADHLASLAADARLRQTLGQHAQDTIREGHTLSLQVDRFLALCAEAQAERASGRMGHGRAQGGAG